MTKDQQKEILTSFVDAVRDAMLSHADKWPDDWDGFELRWLAREAFDHESLSATIHTPYLREQRRHERRRRAFLKHRYLTKLF